MLKHRKPPPMSTTSKAICCLPWLAICWIQVARATDVEGFLEPYSVIEVAASDTGLLSQLNVRLGDRVIAGQAVASLDTNEWEAKVRVSKAEKEMVGEIEYAKSEVALQRAIVEKLQKLQSRQHASEHEMERAQTQLRIAEARLTSALEQSKISAMQFDLAEIALAKRHLHSPIDGIVTEIFRDRGEYVSLNEPTVLKIVQLDPLLVVFSVPVASTTELEQGQTVQLYADLTSREVQGTVEFISPTPDPQSGTTAVRVKVPNQDERISSGLKVRLRVSDSTNVARQFVSRAESN